MKLEKPCAESARAKLTYHQPSQRWSKVIGKRLSKNGRKLVQAQFYFTADHDRSVVMALAKRLQWDALKTAWKKKHEPDLKMLNDPHASIPHWYQWEAEDYEYTLEGIGPMYGHENKVDDEPVVATRVAATVVPTMPQPRDISVGECEKLFCAYRVTREGKDFKAETNKSFETDLRGGIACLGSDLMISCLRGFHINDMREKLEEEYGDRTAYNYGMAVHRMLDWYFVSKHFNDGVPPKGLSQEFDKFVMPEAKKPKPLRLDVVKIAFQKATKRRRLYLLLMLNTGMQPTDIPVLRTRNFNLDTGIVKWRRKKNKRIRGRKGRIIQSLLWPETLILVREMIAKDGFAFRTVNGDSLYHRTAKRNRHNAVTKSLTKFFKRLRIKFNVIASAKRFRTTGSQLIHKASGSYGLARNWLGREFKRVDRSYLDNLHRRLHKVSMRVRDRLVRKEIFPQAGGR